MTLFTPDTHSAIRTPIRILLVDDHLVTRMGLRTLFSGYAQFEVISEAGTVASAVAEAQRVKPDVILLDVRLPDGNGFDACRQIQQLGLEIRVLILTSYADDDTLFQCLSVGADGYLLKEIDPPGLVRAIEAVAAGQSILDPAVTRQVLSRFRAPGIDADSRDKLSSLSAQERRVLAFVAEGRTNKEIAAEMGLSEKTVKNYLSNTLEKLHVTRRSSAAALFARGRHSLP